MNKVEKLFIIGAEKVNRIELSCWEMDCEMGKCVALTFELATAVFNFYGGGANEPNEPTVSSSRIDCIVIVFWVQQPLCNYNWNEVSAKNKPSSP